MNSQDYINFTIMDRLIKKYGIQSVIGYSEKITSLEDKKDPYKSYFIKFNVSGTIDELEEYNSQGELIKKVFFNKDDKKSKEIIYKSGNVDYEIKYTYNDKDDRVHRDIYYEGKLSRGFILEKINLKTPSENPNIKHIEIYTYIDDGEGNLKQTPYTESWTYEYNADSLLIMLSGNFTSGSKSGENYEFYYDDRGLLIKIIQNHDRITLFEYSNSFK